MELNEERGVLIYVADPTLTAPTDELLAEKTRNKIYNKKGTKWGSLETVMVGDTAKPFVKVMIAPKYVRGVFPEMHIVQSHPRDWCGLAFVLSNKADLKPFLRASMRYSELDAEKKAPVKELRWVMVIGWRARAGR